MKRLPLFPALIGAIVVSLLLSAPARAQDDHVRIAKMYVRTLEESMAKAKDHPDDPRWWAQCAGDFKSLEGETAKVPENERAPFTAKLKAVRAEVEAGALAGRGFNVARSIRDSLASAREDLKDGPVSDRTMDRLGRDFADEGIKGIPAADLKKLEAEYAEVKRLDAAATAKAKAANP